MGSSVTQKPHAVLVPFPAQGHVNPLMQLAKLLHSRGFYVTFVNTEFNHKRLIRSKGPDAVKGSESFKFETIPDGLPPSDKDATQHVPTLCYTTQKTCFTPFLELLNKLKSSSDVPPVTCVVADGVTGFAIDAAKQLGIPDVQFWTASACGFMGYLHFSDLVKRGIVPFKDESYISDGTLEMPIDWVPGMPNIRLKDIPDFIRTTDPNDIMLNFLGGEAEKCLKASTILFNTFDTFEHEVLEAIKAIHPNIYTTGPLSTLIKHIPKNELNSFRSSLWKEDTTCFDWLDKWEPESVVYVNYGCTTLMSDQHLQEFAWGLANSKHPFLWIIRPDIVMGDTPILSQEFLDEIQGRALLINWCPQDEVLCHPSVGAFLSHCGWNSTIESVCGGVPMICWPFFSEQCTNCRYACEVWGFGMELQHDVKRQEVEAVVREMMESEKGKKLRKKAQEWKKEIKKATDIGGSSYVEFDRFIKEALNFKCE